MREPVGRRIHGRVLSATFVGAVFTLLVILCFYAYRQIERERERMLEDLRLKGTTLIHSLEAGARVGMVGMMGGRQPLQTLLEEAARDPQIVLIEVINEDGKVIGSTQHARIGTMADDSQLWQALSSGQLLTSHEEGVFRLFAPFRPSTIDAESARRMQDMMQQMMGKTAEDFLPPMNLAIRMDLSMGRVETALREEMGKAILTALICFSGGRRRCTLSSWPRITDPSNVRCRRCGRIHNGSWKVWRMGCFPSMSAAASRRPIRGLASSWPCHRPNWRDGPSRVCSGGRH